MTEPNHCHLTFNRDGELIFHYPDGIIDATGIYPSMKDREICKEFANSSTGISILMRQHKMLLLDDRTGLLTAKAGTELVHKRLEKISNIKFTGAMSVIFIDIDHFGKINKDWGHPTGDHVLAWFAKILETRTRPDDVVIRWGGEEFVIFTAQGSAPPIRLNETNEISFRDRDGVDEQSHGTGTTNENEISLANLGSLVASRIKKTLDASTVSTGGQNLKITATFGCATKLVHPHDNVMSAFEELFSEAENAERLGKNNNQRNEIHVAKII